MTINKTKWIAALAAIVLTSLANDATATDFRGLPLDQGGNELFNPTLDRILDTGTPYWLDLTDNFNRDGALPGSEVDGWQVGFVPPAFGVPDGELSGTAADDHGRWMSGQEDEYVTTTEGGGRVQRLTGDGVSVTCLPWVVEEGLGDYYTIEMMAHVAAGESVQLAYFGDVNQFGAAQGLANELGQLVLGIERGTGASEEQLTWTIAWDIEGNRQEFSATLPRNVAVGDEVRLQLGWLDEGQNDLFDAWLETPDGTTTRLGQGNMLTSIEVRGVGFEFSGLGSYASSFAAAVPEPSTVGLLLSGLLLMAGAIRRRG